MMKKVIVKIIFLLALTLIVVSCGKDFLDVEPKGLFLEDNFYRDADDAFEALVAVYDQVGGASGGYINKFTGTLSASDDQYAGGANSTDVYSLQVWSNYTL